MTHAFTETRVKVAEVNAGLENSISGIRVAKAFANKEYEIQKFQKDNLAFQKAREFAYKAMAEFFSGMNFIVDFLNVLVLLVGGYFVYQYKIQLGDFVAYLLYINLFLRPIRKLIQFIEQYQSGMTGFKRFIELMEAKPESEIETPIQLQDVQGQIDFKNVSFMYDENSHILNNINLTIEKGKTVALVGPSGGGKTTLCHLIPRFYEIDEGQIYIDNVDIKFDVSLAKYCIVQQDVFYARLSKYCLWKFRCHR